MKAVVLEKPGLLSLAEVGTEAAPAADEARVRIRRVGICGTDLKAFKGVQPYFTYPRILGHELSGEIEEIAAGNGLGLKAGDRCAIEPYLNCGGCGACRRGKSNCCAQLQVMGVHTDGGLRESLRVPLGKLHPSAKLTFDQLALVEMLSIGAHAVRRAALAPEDEVLVLGAGPIGMAVMEFAIASGCSPIALDVDAARLAYCRDALKVERTLLAGDDPLARILKANGGRLPTAVFDCTGNAQSMHNAFQYVEHGGKLIFVGLTRESIAFQDPHFHGRELTLLASRNATAEDFRQVVRAMEAGRIHPEHWITHRVGYKDVAREFPGWAAGQANFRKALVEWQ